MSTEVIFTPKERIWAGQTIRFSAILESLRLRVAQPSLGVPLPLPEGLEDLGQVDAAESYRSWIWAQPRRHLNILMGGVVWATVPLLNRVPFYVVNLMPYLSSQSTARIAARTSLSVAIVDAGFGPISSQDSIVVMGEGVQECDVEDLAPQFSELEQTLSSLLRSQTAGLSNRLATIEEWTIAQAPKIAALQTQGAANTLDLAQAVTDIGWMRRNWGSGTSGGTGGGETIAPLTSTAGAVSSTIVGAGKFRAVPPGTYKIRISIDPALMSQVADQDEPKTIEIVSWSEEPTDTVLQYGDSTNYYNWNTAGVVKWVKDLPKAGGEVTITSTSGRQFFGVKIRNTNKSNYWGGEPNHFLDGVFVTEQTLAGYSAEWVARSF